MCPKAHKWWENQAGIHTWFMRCMRPLLPLYRTLVPVSTSASCCSLGASGAA